MDDVVPTAVASPEPDPGRAPAPAPTTPVPGHPDDLTVVVADGPEGLVLLLAGEVDSVRVGELADVLRDHTGDLTVPAQVDLSSLTYLPSMALAVLVRAQRAAEAAGSSLVLQAARGTIAQRVLRAAGVEHRPL